jgi:dUTP pyrophosphatase
VPKRSNPGDAGLDLYAYEDVFIPIGGRTIVKTGIAMEVPFGFVGKIEDRSSMASKGLKTSGGIIDHGYTGEIGVILTNQNITGTGYQIKKGDKIAQILINPIALPEIIPVTELSESERGDKGFGSSGR